MDEVTAALAQEYALPPPGMFAVMLARVLTAAVLGGIVGYERERKGRAAGFKTHILVSIGSALFVLAPAMAQVPMTDITRVMQGIVSGIGFLGAGAIMKMPDSRHVEGLTTAAGIWMTSAVGMAAGMGMEIVALVTSLVALLVVSTMPRLMKGSLEKHSAPDDQE